MDPVLVEDSTLGKRVGSFSLKKCGGGSGGTVGGGGGVGDMVPGVWVGFRQ